jgi:Skp family chaperone for outer membrane proteins
MLSRENYDLILYDNVAFVSDKVDISKEIIAEIEKL